MRTLVVPLVYLRVAALHELQYRAHLVLQLVHTTTSLALALVGLQVVFAHGGQINGWTPDQLLVVVGLFLAVSGVIGTVIQPGLNLLMEQVRKGTLDFTLMKPADAQFLVSIQAINPWKLVDVIAGAAVVGVGLARQPEWPSAMDVLLCAVLGSCGLVCLYSVWVALATLSFWFVRTGELLEIARMVFDSARWPVSLYPPWLRHTLTWLIPAGLSVTLPAQALTGGIGQGSLTAGLCSAIVTTAVARLAWRRGIRQYSGASA